MTKNQLFRKINQIFEDKLDAGKCIKNINRTMRRFENKYFKYKHTCHLICRKRNNWKSYNKLWTP
jgi:hypothetical protein